MDVEEFPLELALRPSITDITALAVDVPALLASRPCIGPAPMSSEAMLVAATPLAVASLASISADIALLEAIPSALAVRLSVAEIKTALDATPEDDAVLPSNTDISADAVEVPAELASTPLPMSNTSAEAVLDPAEDAVLESITDETTLLEAMPSDAAVLASMDDEITDVVAMPLDDAPRETVTAEITDEDAAPALVALTSTSPPADAATNWTKPDAVGLDNVTASRPSINPLDVARVIAILCPYFRIGIHR